MPLSALSLLHGAVEPLTLADPDGTLVGAFTALSVEQLPGGPCITVRASISGSPEDGYVAFEHDAASPTGWAVRSLDPGDPVIATVPPPVAAWLARVADATNALE
jgi:hypothetical protein